MGHSPRDSQSRPGRYLAWPRYDVVRRNEDYMNRTLRHFAALTLAWYVVTYSGQRVAGPFTLLNECSDMAELMAKRYFNVSTLCRSF